MRQKIVRSLAALLLAVGCDGGPTGPGARPVARVEIAPDSAGLEVAGSLQLQATLTDRSGEEITGRAVYWSSADSTIARVSSSGMVTGIIPGKVRIAASAEGVSSLATLTVELPAVASVSVLPDRVTVLVGDTAELTAVARDRADRPLTGRAIAWTSENAAVASVDASGRVVGRAPGTTRVVATSEGKSAAASVTVLPQPVATVSVSPTSLALKVGESGKLAASAKADDGSTLTGRTVAWSTGDAKIATVDAGGNVTGVTVGTVKVTATVEGKSASATVTVGPAPGGPPPPPPPVTVATVTVSPATVALTVGGEQKLTATARAANDSILTGRAVSWSSSVPSVASIGSDGVVKALSVGTTTIIATVEGKTGTATVTVSPVPVASVEVSPPAASVLVGATTDLSAVAKSASGEVLTGRAVTWSSDDEAIATVDASGKVTGVAPGSATVTATVEGKSASAEITVSAVPVATVTVKPATVSLPAETQRTLTATVEDAHGNELTGRAVTWSTSDAGVATVGKSTGVVTGVAPGTATITATVEGKTGTARVTVTPAKAATVAVTPSTATVFVGRSTDLEAVAKSARGTVLTGRKVDWQSSRGTVASVDGKGKVTGKAPGSATITATIEGKSGTAAVTVKLVPVATVVVTPATASLTVGDEKKLAATAKASDGSILTGRAVSWSSSAPAVASVGSDGVVKAVGAGTATITATVEGKTGSAAITVAAIPVASVAVSPPTATVLVGESTKLDAIAKSADGTVLTGRTVEWSSSATSVATVAPDGRVTAVAPGKATITATVEGVPATATVTVIRVPVETVAVTPSDASLVQFESTTLTAVVEGPDGKELTDRPVSWKSSDEAIATVDASGKVTGVAPGIATITASAEGESGTAKVTVTPAPVATVGVEPATVSLFVGDAQKLSATARAENGSTLTGRAVSWSSSDDAVAAVGGDGTVTAVAPGTATITATVEGVAGTATVTVSLVPVASVDVQPPTASIEIGDSVQLTATPKASDGTPLTDRAVAWSSSDPAVASVSDGGRVTGVAEGTATITATSDEVPGSATVTVTPVPVASVSVTPATARLTVGGDTTLTAVAKSADGTVLTGRTVEWSSSDASVASVDASGTVTAVAPGDATITATVEGRTGGATVTVTAIPATLEKVSGDDQHGTNDAALPEPLVVRALDADGLPVEGVTVTWTTENGSLTPTTGLTDANGRASSMWTLGGGFSGLVGHAHAAVAGLPAADFVATWN